MREAWPFFQTTLDNLEMVLAKSDMAIAERYARAGRGPRARRPRSSPASATRGRRRTTRCSRSPARARLLEKNPLLDASIRLRLPYIDPLNLLQVELLKRHRAGEKDPRVREGIQLSINAVATALRNSG